MRYVWLAASGLLLLGTSLQAQQKAPPAQVAPAPPVQLDPAHNRLDALLLQWENKMKGIDSLSAEVSRKTQDKTFGTQETFDGKAKYLKPNLALLDMHRRDRPNLFEKYICSGTFLYEFNRDNREVRVHEMPPPKPGQVADDNFLAFLLGMKAEEARRRYELQLVKEDQNWIYVLVFPRFAADKADFQKAQLVLSANSFLPRMLTFIESVNGNTVNWDIPAIELNARLDRNEFTKPAIPPGWKMVRATDTPPAGQNGVPPRIARPKQ